MDRAVVCAIVEILFYTSLTFLDIFLPLLNTLSFTFFSCQIFKKLFVFFSFLSFNFLQHFSCQF